VQKRTKIIATIGPASDSQEAIEALLHEGVDVFRLNFSHGTHQYHSEVLQKIRQAEKNTGLLVGVLQDISGPKVRIGDLKDSFELQENDSIEFLKEELTGYQVNKHKYRISINQPQILDQLKVGDPVYLYDGMIRTIVTQSTAFSVTVKVENRGVLSSKKGINFPNTFLDIDIITAKDKKDILWGIQNDIDFMAISFVQSADDMLQARKILEEQEANIQLFAKIEKLDAIKNIDSILEVSDGIMIARGDLGIELPFYEVPSLQKRLIQKANNASKPVITATQMLLSMTDKERATRAEISDIANAVLDGTDAVMLSEESAVGKHPSLVVKTMVQTIKGAERDYPFDKFDTFELRDATDSVNESAVKLCQSVDAWGLICVTASGASARKIARYRPQRDIYAVVHTPKIARFLTICWGVVPAFHVEQSSLSQMIKQVISEGKERKILYTDRSYILTAGDPMGAEGSTNTIRLLRRREMEFFHDLP